MKAATCPDCRRLRLVVRQYDKGPAKGSRTSRLVLRAHGCPSDRRPVTDARDVTFRRKARS